MNDKERLEEIKDDFNNDLRLEFAPAEEYEISLKYLIKLVEKLEEKLSKERCKNIELDVKAQRLQLQIERESNVSDYGDCLPDLYICPMCREEYEHFRDVMNCYKNCSVGGKDNE